MFPIDDIRTIRKWFNGRYGEWEAEGLVTIRGADVRWRAFQPASSERWEVEVPGGQNVATYVVDQAIEMLDQIRAHLLAPEMKPSATAA